MRIVTFLLVISIMQVSASSFAQKVSLYVKNLPLSKVFIKVSQQSGYEFLVTGSILKNTKPVTLNVKDADLEEVLKMIFKNQPLSYQIEDKVVTVTRTPVTSTQIEKESKSIPIPIHGKVIDSLGKGLTGATVAIQGKTIAVSTAPDGSFTINAEPGDQLVVSFIGFNTQTAVVRDGRESLTIILHENANRLNDVVVVGYGTQSRAKVVGSIVTVNENQLKDRGAANISALINGQAPGVTVLQRGGAPGRNEGTINIRGIGSVGKSNSPLIIVDGIETGSITDINPNDVANISILKDASAASIYGVRAANGVIIVTTKRGKAGKPVVNYNGQFGGSAYIALPEKASSFDLATLYNEAQINSGVSPANVKFTQADLDKFKSGSNPLTHANTDQVGNLFSESGLWNSHNLAVSGGTETGTYNVSVGYLSEDGLIKNAGLKRYNFRANLDKKISKRLTLGANLSAAFNDITNPPAGAELLIHTAIREWPNDAAVTSTGQYINPAWSGLTHNSLALNDPSYGTNTNSNSRLIGTGYLEYKIIDGLSIKGILSGIKDNNVAKIKTIGVDLYNIDLATSQLSSSPALGTIGAKGNPTVYRGFDTGLDLNSQALLNYEKTLNGKHYVKALLGYEQRNINLEDNTLSRGGLANPLLDQISAGDANLDNATGTILNDYRSRAFFGNLNYIYDSRYLLGASLRRDGVSRFAENNRWGTFPSFSAGWRISNEKFFKVSWIDDFKLRASWGKLGNQDIGNYRFLSTYNLGSSYILNNSLVNGITEGSLANPDISWETTTTMNYGLDLGLFNGKFTVSADYFIKNTDDILLAPTSPAILGAAAPLNNSGKVKNTGFETVIGYKSSIGEVNYYVNANFSYVKNEIVDITNGKTVFGQTPGLPLQNFMGYVAEGLFQNQTEIDAHANQDALGGNLKPGDIKYKDLNGDGVVNTDDRKLLGSPFPKINYGFSFGVSYKGFDLSTVWQGTADVQYSLYGTRLGNDLFWVGGAAPFAERMDRWQKEGDQTRYPRATFTNSNNGQSSSFWIENTSYLKLRNAQIGYNLPKSLLRKLGVQSVRIYTSGENLLTITPFKMGLDPEAVSTGDPFFFRPTDQSNNVYPTTKRYLIGLNVTF